jgi:hypothetical protein
MKDYEAEVFMARYQPCESYSSLNPWCHCKTCMDYLKTHARQPDAFDKREKRYDAGLVEWGIAEIRVGD